MRTWRTSVVFGAALFAAAIVGPSPAVAQDAVLYEVSETMTVKGGKMARRVANAALVGWANGGTGICPAPITRCQVTAFAQDNINLATGRGPVKGSFAIVVQDQNDVDGPELVVFQGSLVGHMDLSPAILGGTPLGSISGTWTARGRSSLEGVDRNGTFTGIFRLPFLMGGVPSYLMGPTSVVPVGSDERSRNTPLVRLELMFQ